MRGLLVLLAACSSGGTVVTTADAPHADAAVPDAPAADAPSACPGAVPTLAQCFSGDFFADCGGSGPQALACSDADGQCRWFSSPCVPADYRLSSCDPASICCDNDWPYPQLGDPYYLVRPLYGLGELPWDRDRAVSVDLVIDPSATTATSQATCTGVDPFPGGTTPCNAPSWTSDHNRVRVRDTVALEIGTMRGYGGWFAWIEIDPARSRVRACAFRITDSSMGGRCVHNEPVCATSGTATLNRVPASDTDRAGLMGSAMLAFPGNFALQLEFAY